MKLLVLFTLQLLFSQYCTEYQGREGLIVDGSGHISSVESVPGSGNIARLIPNGSGDISSVERHLDSGNFARYKKGRMRHFRRIEKMVKWCTSKTKAKEIDNAVGWKKIIGASVFVLVLVVVVGLVHVLYFYVQFQYEWMV